MLLFGLFGKFLDELEDDQTYNTSLLKVFTNTFSFDSLSENSSTVETLLLRKLSSNISNYSATLTPDIITIADRIIKNNDNKNDLNDDIKFSIQEEDKDEENFYLENEIQKTSSVSSWFDEVYKDMKLFF